ncbi:MAG: carbamoyl-phosphate synthase large subunit [Kiritimatiellia bacterium]|jgi:carbamoyl-phosphate synthase large subunit
MDVLMPTLDSELPALLDQEERLTAMGIHTFLPTREQFEMRSKARLSELAENTGLPVPEGVCVHDASALYNLAAHMGSPMVVKGVFYGAQVCYTVDEAVSAFHKQAAKWGLPIIVQRFVPGDEVNVCAVGDGQGGLVGAVPMKKLMLTDNGKGWAGVTIRDESLMQLTRDFMTATRWRGPCEVEARQERDGTLHLIEVNPRFPAWCDLCAGAGQNLISAVVDLALGKPVTIQEYTVGTAFIRISLNQIVPITALESISTLGEVITEVRP